MFSQSEEKLINESHKFREKLSQLESKLDLDTVISFLINRKLMLKNYLKSRLIIIQMV